MFCGLVGCRRNVGRDVGAYCTIRVDMRAGTITYITKHGERECVLKDTSEKLFAAVDRCVPFLSFQKRRTSVAGSIRLPPRCLVVFWDIYS